MKTLYTLILLGYTSITLAQHIDGPANLRNAPNGDKLFSVNDYVWVQLETKEPINNWYEIKLRCYVLPTDLINKTTIKANTPLLSINGDSIGFTYIQFDIENDNKNYYAYNDLEQIEIIITGHTFKSNIRKEITNSEIIANKKSFVDSCTTTYLNYQEENGQAITLIEKCNIYPTSIVFDGKSQSVLIKEKQSIKRLSGANEQHSVIDLEIVQDYFTDNPTSKHLIIEADKVVIQYHLIKGVKYGCCGGENRWELYNSESLKPIMKYDENLYNVEIPNSKTVGYFGYTSKGYNNNETVIGYLTFTDSKEIRNIVNFATKDKNKFDKILRFVPDMEFKPIHERDKVHGDGSQIALWSQNGKKGVRALTGFKFLIHLMDDSTSEVFIQELTITNGYINGNPEKEFTIWID